MSAVGRNAAAVPEEHFGKPGSPSPRIEAAAFVLALRGRGISDLGVLRAMETVPRDLFASRRFGDLSRQDVALPLACGETMTGPTTVASMLAALAVRPGHRVLEIGTGSGYVTALLARMGATIHTVERRLTLAESAWYRLRAGGFASSCDLDWRDGLRDDAGGQRFDRILLNGSVATVAPWLTSRLSPGGRLVFGETDERGPARLGVIARGADGQLVRHVGQTVRLTRLVQADSEAPANGSLTPTRL